MLHRLAIFGDSHYACLKNAFDAGEANVPQDVDIEFWGHVGTRFRMLSFVNEAITPTDDYTAMRFAKFNAHNRTSLPIREFDTVFFMGCRIPLFNIFGKLIQAARAGQNISAGLRRRILRDHLEAHAPYGFAQKAAALNAAHIIVAPNSFPTWAPKIDIQYLPKYPDAHTTERRERHLFLTEVENIMREDGITLLRQPYKSITQGIFTKPRYAVDGYIKKVDLVHRNSEFGALIFADFWKKLELNDN